jgi:hypothetical protein
MSATYWKFIGEKIANGLGAKTIQRLGTGGKLLGRTGAVVGIGFLAYEFIKSYKDNIENEPAYQEMTILQIELEKWTIAISCLGSEYSAKKEYGSVDEGGAINALYPKKAIKGQGVKDADLKEAYTLIGRAMNSIRQTENIAADEQFEKKKKALVLQLRKLQLQLNKAEDLRSIQKRLGQIVSEIRHIAVGYSSRIYDCSREIQKSIGSNAAWAAISMTTLGLVKKPHSRPG